MYLCSVLKTKMSIWIVTAVICVILAIVVISAAVKLAFGQKIIDLGPACSNTSRFSCLNLNHSHWSKLLGRYVRVNNTLSGIRLSTLDYLAVKHDAMVLQRGVLLLLCVFMYM